MNPTIKQLEAAIAAANEKLAELKAAGATHAEKAWPQNGDRYWTLDDTAEVSESMWAADYIDAARMAIGNVFRTKADAEREGERRIVLTTLRRLARESWGGSRADWSNACQGKWCLYFFAEWRAGSYNEAQFQGCVYFATREAAEAAIKTIGVDRLMLLLED